MVRKCLGLSGGPACQFAQGGKAAQPKPGQSPCSWCDPELLSNACGKAGGRARLKQLLRNMPRDSQRAALRRLPEEIYADNFEAEFGMRDVTDDLSAPADGQESQTRDGSDTEDADSIDLHSVSEAGSLERDLGDLMDAMIAAEREEEAGPK